MTPSSDTNSVTTNLPIWCSSRLLSLTGTASQPVTHRGSVADLLHTTQRSRLIAPRSSCGFTRVWLLRGVQVLVAEELLHLTEVRAGAEELRRERRGGACVWSDTLSLADPAAST